MVCWLVRAKPPRILTFLVGGTRGRNAAARLMLDMNFKALVGSQQEDENERGMKLCEYVFRNT